MWLLGFVFPWLIFLNLGLPKSPLELFDVISLQTMVNCFFKFMVVSQINSQILKSETLEWIRGSMSGGYSVGPVCGLIKVHRGFHKWVL